MDKFVVILSFLFLSVISSYSQDESLDSLKKLVFQNSQSLADDFFNKMLINDSLNPELPVAYVDILIEYLNRGYDFNDSTGKVSGKLKVGLDTNLMKKAIKILEGCYSRFPYRLDISFYIADLYRDIDDFENQFKYIKTSIIYGLRNSEKVRWKDNRQNPEPINKFLSDMLYDYSTYEYNKETSEGDENYLKLSELLSEKFPEHKMSYQNIAYYYYNKKDWNKSIIYFEKANEAHPGDNNILYNLAENYLMLKQIDKGKNCLNNIIELNSDIQIVEYAKKRLSELK